MRIMLYQFVNFLFSIKLKKKKIFSMKFTSYYKVQYICQNVCFRKYMVMKKIKTKWQGRLQNHKFSRKS